MLTTLSLQTRLRRRLDGDPSLSVSDLRDAAGEHLVSMHPWSWLIRPAARLTLVSGRDTVQLPSDWGRAKGEPKASTTTSLLSFKWVGVEQLLELRSSVVTQAGPNYFGSVTYALNDRGVYAPRIEIWPIPSETIQGAFLAPYIAGWSAPQDDGDALPLPSWMEAFYLEVVYAFAQGYDEHDLGSQAARLAELEDSPAFIAAKRRDSGVQPFVGQMRGGAMASEIYDTHAKVGIAVRLQGPTQP